MGILPRPLPRVHVVLDVLDVAPALKQGAELLLIEPRDRWSLVEVVRNPDVEGWVSNSFIAPVSEPRELRPQEARTLAPADEAPAVLVEKRKGRSGKSKRKAGGRR